MTLHKWLGKNSPYGFDGEIGLEIETECLRGYEPPQLDYWTTHADGSLRNVGVEYVLRSPLDYGSKEYHTALQEFKNKTKAIKFEASVYTSVHVHFNQKNRTLQQLFNFITLYMLFEEALTRYCGPDRDGNLFCLKTSNSERNLYSIIDLCEQMSKGNRRKVGTLNSSQLKYAGLNIAPLRNFGSLEVRTHPGTTDIDLIDRWVGMLHRGIYNNARLYKDPVEIINSFNKLGPKEFFDLTFGDYAKYLEFNAKDYDKTLWYAALLAGCVDDWDNFGDEKKEENKFRSFKITNGNTVVYHQDEDVLNGRHRELQEYWDNNNQSVINPTVDM